MDVRGFVALSLFFCLTAATLIGFWLFKWTANRPIHDRLVLAVLPFVLVAVSESSLYQVLITPHLYWSGARLAPTVALTYGHKIYQLVGQGSLLDTFYGPISYLIYLPAALTSSVTISILIASVISVLFFFVPVLWLHILEGRNNHQQLGFSILLFGLFGLLTLNSLSLKYSAFNIHADSPALGFSAFACGFIYWEVSRTFARRDTEEKQIRLVSISTRVLIITAVFAILGLWAKQSMLPIAIGLGGYLWLVAGWKTCLRYYLILVTILAVISGILFRIFGFKELIYNLVTVPANQPWVTQSLLATLHPQITNNTKLELLVMAAQQIIIAEFPLILIAIAYATYSFVKLGYLIKFSTIRIWMLVNPWLLFLSMSILTIPMVVRHRVITGADDNSFSPTYYFLAIAITLATVQLASGKSTANSINQRILIKTVAICLSLLLSCVYLRQSHEFTILVKDLSTNSNALVYQVLQAFPNRFYFPFHPLSSLRATGNTYSFPYGLESRQLAGTTISQDAFQSGIPEQFDIVAMPSEVPFDLTDRFMKTYLPEFSQPISIDVLPDWRAFKRS